MGTTTGGSPDASAERQAPTPAFLHNPGWLDARYTRDGMTIREIAALCGATRTAVHEALVRHEIQRRPVARRFLDPRLDDALWLREQYVHARRTTLELAELLGVTTRAVNKALRRAGIELRPRFQRPVDGRVSEESQSAINRAGAEGPGPPGANPDHV